MLESHLPSSISIAVSRQDLNLRSGDIVSIQVIKRLTTNKWAIGFRGRVYPAQSDLELQPGQTLKVKVINSSGTLQFKITANSTDSPVLNFLKAQGIPGDVVTQQIVAALMRSEMVIDPEIVYKIRNRFQKEQKATPSLIRLLISVLGKGIRGAGEEVEPLLALLDYGGRDYQQQGSSGQKRRPYTPLQIRKYFQEVITAGSQSGDNLLPLFNHLGEGTDTWIVIPYTFPAIRAEIRGTLRLLISIHDGEVKKGALIVYSGSDEKWSFFINPGKKITRVMVFSNKKLYIDKKSGKFKTLRSNLENIGVKIDDIVYDDKYFDGFLPLNEELGYKSVNTII